jgi:hypothetical protein
MSKDLERERERERKERLRSRCDRDSGSKDKGSKDVCGIRSTDGESKQMVIFFCSSRPFCLGV